MSETVLWNLEIGLNGLEVDIIFRRLGPIGASVFVRDSRYLFMRKINVLEFISLDGVIQGPGGQDEDTSDGFELGGWMWPHSDSISSGAMKECMEMPFDLLIGRKTFDIWAPYWLEHNEVWPGVNTATKYVASNTITSHKWQPTIFLNGDVASKIAKLKDQDGPDLHVYGSSNLLQTLMKHGLVDAFWLKIYPITLGKGKRLFGDGTIPAAFKLSDCTITTKGVIIVNYERAGVVPIGGPK